MNRIFLVGLFILCTSIHMSIAQTVDLTSVDEFFNITSSLKQGKEVSEEQWKDFDNSISYKKFAESENKFLINTIKSSIQIVFDNGNEAEKDSILNISKKEMAESKTLMMKKLILTNYLDIRDNYDSIKSFRENYDFNALVEKAKQRLSSFLRRPIGSTTKFKPVYFFFLNADGKDGEDAIFVDFNLVYKITEDQRIDFLAHEFFHNYRRKYENHDFNYKCDLNFGIDMIQNEGIADRIDKTEGYKKYYANVLGLPEMVETMVDLYNQAEEDLERLHNLILNYSINKTSEKKMVDEWIEIVKFNGHPIGFFMANQIVSAGYENEMLKTFYNPYEFFNLYNKAAKEQNHFQLSDEFMNYLKDITKEYYR